ncbi:MAG: FG-GAP repeat domain-containing protein, partial [Desulfatiglandales bacterium]
VGLSDKVEIYKFKDRRLSKLAEYSSGDKIPAIGIDVADINRDGKAEIFVSRVSRGTVSSMVLQYQNGRLVPIVRDSDYLFRIMDLPGSGTTLLGQRMLSGTEETHVDLIKYYFDPAIIRLEWTGNGYVSVGEISIPVIKGLYLYNFILGDMDMDGSPEIVVIDTEEKINVFSMTGERLYKSTESFGSTLNYIRLNPEKEGSRSQVRLQINDLYLPPRMAILDIEGDGKKELIVVKNTSSSP